MSTSDSQPHRARRNISRWLWRAHRWLGLGLGIVVILLSLTGSLLVFHHDWERWLQPERHVVSVPPAGTARAPLATILQRLQTEAPAGYRLIRLESGHGPTDSEKILFISPDRRTRWSAFVNPWTGDILWRGADQSLVTPWLLHLHMHLHIGTWGYVITGLAALALTILGLTGLWLTRDRLARLLHWPFRRTPGGRTRASELHKWTGLVSLYFTLVLGGTGVWFAILIVPFQFREKASLVPAPAFALSRLAPVEPALATVAREFPGAEVLRIGFPADDRGKLQIRVLHRDAPVWAKFSRMDFDPVTGAPQRIARASEATTAQKWQAILAPLHFGFYGSTLVKWLYVLGGALPAVLALTGILIWWRRQRPAARTANTQTFSEPRLVQGTARHDPLAPPWPRH